jgi:hypothetical protein
MTPTHNRFGQPIGFPLGGWIPPPSPPREPMEGRLCQLEPLDSARHAEDLFTAFAADTEGPNWTYLAYGPFSDLASYRAWMNASCLGDDPLFFAISQISDGKPAGVASATEAMYLMMKRAFGLGYRRYEWKCDALNAASRRAAQRLGLSFEGIFRQATVYKDRNRDTAWYAAIDSEWPRLEEAFLTWLDPSNFDGNGKQRTRLTDLTLPMLKQRG